MTRAAAVLSVVLCSVVSSAATLPQWSELPPIDPGRRAALVERLVREAALEWEPDAGGIAPEVGAVPSFRVSAWVLLGMWEAPDTLIDEIDVPREEWTADLVEKMTASQVRDLAEADPARYPRALYGSVNWPWWRSEDEWPVARSRYEWDMFVPSALAVLHARHASRLPAATRVELETILWYAADGALRTWYAVRTLPGADALEDYWGHDNYTLMNLETLILAGEASGQAEAVRAGIEGLARWLSDLRRRGLHEFASPTYLAVDLDALALIAQEARDPSARRMAANAWAFLWTDMLLTLTDAGDGSLAMGGPASRSYTPLVAAGDHLTHLFLAGVNSASPGTNPADGLRAAIERRPPDALLALARPPSSREAVACWGDDPGEDRSWWVEPGLLVGAASAPYGGQDHLLAVDLPPPAARVHLSADRGIGDGGLPSGAGTGHTPIFLSSARRGRTLLAVAEAHPQGFEERTTLLLFLPGEVSAVSAGESDLELPPVGTDAVWPLAAGEWVAVAAGGWWVAAAVVPGAQTTAQLRAPAEPAEGVRVLRIEVHPNYQQQPVVAALALVALPQTQAATGAEVRAALSEVSFAAAGTAEGLRTTVAGGPFGDAMEVVHDTVFAHGLIRRDPEPPPTCGVGAPLEAPGLLWAGTRLTVTTAAGSTTLDLAGRVTVRRPSGRAGAPAG